MPEFDQELARNLGFLEAYTLGLGTMIATGIVVLPRIVAESAGPATMIPFTVDDTVALLGPYASRVSRRAGELRRAFAGTLTLLNGQPESAATDGEPTDDELIDAEDAGLEDEEYETRVLVADDVADALVASASEYDTAVVGTAGTSTVAKALYGSIPQRIVERSGGTVVVTRGEQRVPRTLRQALIQRLEG